MTSLEAQGVSEQQTCEVSVGSEATAPWEHKKSSPYPCHCLESGRSSLWGHVLGARVYTRIPLLAIMPCNLGISAETSAPALGAEINVGIQVGGGSLVLEPLSKAGQDPDGSGIVSSIRPSLGTRRLGELGELGDC